MDGLFGKRLREQRQLKGYTLEVLAEKSGLSTNYLGDVERGKKSVSLETLQKLASALDVSADALLRDSIPAASYITDAEIAQNSPDLRRVRKRRHWTFWTLISIIFRSSPTSKAKQALENYVTKFKTSKQQSGASDKKQMLRSFQLNLSFSSRIFCSIR